MPAALQRLALLAALISQCCLALSAAGLVVCQERDGRQTLELVGGCCAEAGDAAQQVPSARAAEDCDGCQDTALALGWRAERPDVVLCGAACAAPLALTQTRVTARQPAPHRVRGSPVLAQLRTVVLRT